MAGGAGRQRSLVLRRVGARLDHVGRGERRRDGSRRVTGEPWAYADWAAGEPSGTYNGTIEDRLQMRGQDGTQRSRETWNDEGTGGFEGLPKSYVIEFEP